jgi:hypothetical protein
MRHISRQALLLIALIAGGSVLTLATAARAEVSASARAEAKKHYERAKELVKAEAFDEAAAEFRKAYEIAPHFEVLYNLGQAYVALGRPVEAADTLSRYLTEGGERILPARRAEVEKEVERQRVSIAELVLSIDPPAAAVAIDGVPVDAQTLAAPISLALGRYVISVTAAGYRPKVVVAQLTKAERRPLTIQLERSSDASPVAPAKLALTCPVADVEVWIDGQKAATTPANELISVAPGARLVRFQRAGYTTVEQRTELLSGSVQALDCGVRPLRSLPPNLGARFALRVSEEHAIVEVDGEPLPATGLVPPGRHRVEVRRAGFQVARFEVVAAAGSTVTREVRLIPTEQFAADYRAGARRQRWLAIAVAGVGVVTGGAGLALYLDNDERFHTWQARQSELDRQWAEDSGTPRAAALESPQAANDELGRKVTARDSLALGFGVAGGVLVGVGAGLWIFGSDPQRYGNLT